MRVLLFSLFLQDPKPRPLIAPPTGRTTGISFPTNEHFQNDLFTSRKRLGQGCHKAHGEMPQGTVPGWIAARIRYG